MSSNQTIAFRDIAKRALGLAPELPRTVKAMAKTLMLNKDKAQSIGAMVERQAKERPNQIAVQYEDQSITYAQFNAAANRYAHYFSSQGVSGGDAVAIFMENRPDVLIAVAGIVKLGAVASMINTSQRGDVLKHSLNLVQPKFCIVGSELQEALDEISEQLDDSLLAARLYVRDDNKEDTPTGYIDLDALLPQQADTNPASTDDVLLGQPAYYIFTSGTTGLPKASVMSHLRWMRACYAMGQAALGTSPRDVFYCCLPLYHNNALTLAWSAVLGGGATLALARKFSASGFWDDIRRYDASMFCYIGELCRYLLSQPTNPLDRQHRVRICVGNGLRPEIWDEFKNRYDIGHINEFYGASEGNLLFTNAFNVDRTAGFCPMSFAVVQYDIEADEPVRNAAGNMLKVAKGESGLLITEVTERFGFEGYTDASASQKKLLHDVFSAGDCWFNTGDLVRDQGFKHIQFVDRLGDTFRWKGENVATTEVEAATNAWPQMEQAVVYGVEVPNCDGRAGMAAITPNCALDEFDFAGFAKHVQEQLPAYALPLFLRVKSSQEVTGTFKYRKVDLKSEGFEPAACKEPLYVLLKGQYQALDTSVYDAIQRGEQRL
ncbi:MAG: long-chain-acyl-CoA synthetase [Oceanococcus sp.]